MLTVYHNISVWSPTFDVSEYCYQGEWGLLCAPFAVHSAPMEAQHTTAPQRGWTTETAPSLLMARYVPSL